MSAEFIAGVVVGFMSSMCALLLLLCSLALLLRWLSRDTPGAIMDPRILSSMQSRPPQSPNQPQNMPDMSRLGDIMKQLPKRQLPGSEK